MGEKLGEHINLLRTLKLFPWNKKEQKSYLNPMKNQREFQERKLLAVRENLIKMGEIILKYNSL